MLDLDVDRFRGEVEKIANYGLRGNKLQLDRSGLSPLDARELPARLRSTERGLSRPGVKTKEDADLSRFDSTGNGPARGEEAGSVHFV